MSTMSGSGAPGRVRIHEPYPSSGPVLAEGVMVTRSGSTGILMLFLPRIGLTAAMADRIALLVD